VTSEENGGDLRGVQSDRDFPAGAIKRIELRELPLKEATSLRLQQTRPGKNHLALGKGQFIREKKEGLQGGGEGLPLP